MSIRRQSPMALTLGEISFVNKLLATESTEDTDMLVEYSVFFRGFRGHLQGLAFK